jgi:hypothetical protein
MSKPKSRIADIPTTLVGVAGEYFVAAELTRRGYVASITLRNTRGVDILATNEAASRHVSIQVKTNTTGRRGWMLNEKSETVTSESHFYVFVNLTDCGTMPEYFIVPCKVVADFIYTDHRQWLAAKGRQGQQRKDTPMRRYQDPEGKYRDNWGLLGL